MVKKQKKLYGTLPLSRVVARITKSAMGSHKGGALGDLMLYWSKIVGDDLAQHSRPLKLTFAKGKENGATLNLGVHPAFSVILQHQETLIIDKINRYLGDNYVRRMTFKQQFITKMVEKIPGRQYESDDTLDAALSRLEKAVLENQRV